MKRISFVLFILSLFFCVDSVGAELLIRDNFEYQVDLADSSTCSRFLSSGGWESVKAINCTGSHRGNIYTTSSIPGYSDSFPGANSNRVLLIEELPYSNSGGDPNAQTDIYLQFGGPTRPTGYIPANVWLQFWIYINRYGSQMSSKLEGKFIYPSPNGNYPANPAWLWGTRTISYQRFWYQSPNPGELFFTNFPPGADDQLAEDYNQWKLGGNLGTSRDGVIVPNQWYLIKMHVDTSGNSSLASPGQGVSEMWIRPLGSDWRKTAEWRGGVTPNFVWPISDNGNKSIRIPTTVAGGDEWVYLDDFAIATMEADLPTYDTTPLVPTLALSASPTTITSGQSSALTWSSTNATSCTASGAWTGTKATSGTQSVSPTSTSTYTLTCTGTGGSVNRSATVTVNPATPTPCSTVTPSNFSQAAYNAYGAPYDLFSGNAQLVDAKCTSADTHTIAATVGKTGDTTRIVYTRGYYFDPGVNNWAQYTGICTGTLNGDWCAGPTTATITDADIFTASAGAPAYFVGMVCSVQGGGWKCGCRDTNCTNFYWQIQGAGL